MATKRTYGPGDERVFIADPGLWPHWPFLPVKRPTKDGGDVEVGVLYATDEPWRHVYRRNLLMLPPTRAEFLALDKHEYDSLDALLADGWIVD
jgi:hypothetical protein